MFIVVYTNNKVLQKCTVTSLRGIYVGRIIADFKRLITKSRLHWTELLLNGEY